MEIGKIAWVVESSYISTDAIIYEVEVLELPAVRHHIKQFKGKLLRRYSYERGWETVAPQEDLQFFRVSRTFVTQEEALTALTCAHQNSIKAAIHYLDSAKSALINAQNSVSFSELRLQSLRKVDLSKVFVRESYVSPFTEKLV